MRPALAVLKEPVNLLTVLASGESRLSSSPFAFLLLFHRLSRLTSRFPSRLQESSSEANTLSLSPRRSLSVVFTLHPTLASCADFPIFVLSSLLLRESFSRTRRVSNRPSLSSPFLSDNDVADLSFTPSRYNYGSLKVGLVLVSFGGGNILGSLLGGRYSDFMRAKLTKANGGITEPEMRLKSMFAAIPVMIGSFLGYAWTAQEKVRLLDSASTRPDLEADNVLRLCAGPHRCSCSIPFPRWFFDHGDLRQVGCRVARSEASRESDASPRRFFASSALAFMVDSNVGRSSAAIACNSFFRGVSSRLLSLLAT